MVVEGTHNLSAIHTTRARVFFVLVFLELESIWVWGLNFNPKNLFVVHTGWEKRRASKKLGRSVSY